MVGQGTCNPERPVVNWSPAALTGLPRRSNTVRTGRPTGGGSYFLGIRRSSMEIIKRESRILPTNLTPEERMVLALEMANSIQAMAVELEVQKNLKDQMKAKLSELQAQQTRLSKVVASGIDYRLVDVESRWVDNDTITEVRMDTGEIVFSRSPRESERQGRLSITAEAQENAR